MMGHPFSQDPSNTAAFAAISGSEPLVSGNQHIRAVVIGGGTGAPVSIRTLLSMGFEPTAGVRRASCAKRRT